MALPGITQTIRDGALGLLALGSGNHVKIGLCTSGVVDTPQAFGDPQTLRETMGRGPLVEAGVYAIEQSGKPVILIRATQATAGSVGTISQTGAGPLITATGSAPEDAFELLVEILVGGAVATAEFRYSLDGGDNYSAAIATAASYVIPDSGITLQFIAGTYVVDEVYSADCTGPVFDSTGLASALDAAIAYSEQWRLAHVVGYAGSASAAATLAATVGAKMATAEGLFRYAYAVLEMPDDTDANLIAEFADFADTRVMLSAGFCELVSAVSGRVYKRPQAWPAVARIMAGAVSRDPGAVADGNLGSSVVELYRDEDKTPGLDAARFLTLRTYKGIPGFYVTQGKMSAASTSDYRSSTNRQVMDVASRTAYEALLQYINIDLITNDAGQISEVEARRIEARVLGMIENALLSPKPPDASAVEYVLDREQNILSTEIIRSKTRVRPKGYARFIENELAFRNPALEPPTT